MALFLRDSTDLWPACRVATIYCSVALFNSDLENVHLTLAICLSFGTVLGKTLYERLVHAGTIECTKLYCCQITAQEF